MEPHDSLYGIRAGARSQFKRAGPINYPRVDYGKKKTESHVRGPRVDYGKETESHVRGDVEDNSPTSEKYKPKDHLIRFWATPPITNWF